MVVVVNLVGQKVNVFTSKIVSADLVAPLLLTTCLPTNGIVCGMDVRYNGVLCISGIAWLKRSLQ
jgi:hypothetical protein